MRDKKGKQDAKGPEVGVEVIQGHFVGITNQQLKMQKSIDISAKKKKKEPLVAYYKSFSFGKNPFLGTHKKEQN